MFISKYGVARHIYIPIVKRAVVDFAVSADWTPAAGDVKISKDGGAAANVTNLPVAIAMGNTAIWDFSLTATEMQAAQIVVTVADAATKAVEDQSFIIQTHGNASAQYQIDLADAVRAGLTALPNANAEAAGGLFTRGTGAGQINQEDNGYISVNVKAFIRTVLTETTGGWIAAAFKKLFDVATPVFTAASVNQTGDSFARLGAPAGASIEADIAAIKSDTGTTLTQTTAATIRADVGLASANLDTQLSTIAGYIDTEVAAIKAKTDNLPSDPADASDIAALFTALSSHGDASWGTISAAGIRAAVGLASANLDTQLATIPTVASIYGYVTETGYTFEQTWRGVCSVLLGKSSGGGTGTEVFRDLNDTKDRITATVDVHGVRSAITRDLT